jgi:hypothetical protein
MEGQHGLSTLNLEPLNFKPELQINEAYMYIVCSDLEGIYVPEVWINVAEKTGIEELRLTTRDISDYDVLMKKRM